MDEDWDESDYKCISFKRVKARKPYVCHYCGNAIPTGQPTFAMSTRKKASSIPPPSTQTIMSADSTRGTNPLT
jgi:hypothetical protein